MVETVEQVIARLVDPGSFQSLGSVGPSRDVLGYPGYAAAIAAAREAGGADDSVVTGTARIDDHAFVLAAGAFERFGGSVGSAHGERVVQAMAHAQRTRTPFVAATASGGARVQEGTSSLLQLARMAEGARRLRLAGVPQIAYLRHPTTGGVLASYASLADVVVADAGATIGFSGPRVVEALVGQSPAGASHTAETALHAGLLDAVVDPDQARAMVSKGVRLLHPDHRGGPVPAAAPVDEPEGRLDPWDAVVRARRADRPSGADYAAGVFDEWLPLRGDRSGGDDTALVAGLGRLGHRTCAVLAQDRRSAGGRMRAAGYRKAVRITGLAARLSVPLVTFVDTPGADSSPPSENAGLASAIAETFTALLGAPAPTVAVVVGEGGSGGAMALAACDRVLMQDDAVFEVVAVEAAAVILHRDAGRAREITPLLGVTAADQQRLGVADRLLPGPTTASAAAAVAGAREQVAWTLAELDGEADRLPRRAARYGPVSTS